MINTTGTCNKKHWHNTSVLSLLYLKYSLCDVGLPVEVWCSVAQLTDAKSCNLSNKSSCGASTQSHNIVQKTQGN